MITLDGARDPDVGLGLHDERLPESHLSCNDKHDCSTANARYSACELAHNSIYAIVSGLLANRCGSRLSIRYMADLGLHFDHVVIGTAEGGRC